ncbi:MAG: sulfurtransferase [Candidatus Promineifilaceae bacterium]
MPFKTLISPETLKIHLGDDDWIVVDCRFSLADPPAGRRAYQTAHIPGAVYAHLDEDLSGPPLTDHGRHPLPSPQHLTDLFSRLGIDSSKQVVAYDNAGGGIAARLWWLLRYMGHENTAVLDGDWRAWRRANFPTTAGMEQNIPATFTGQPHQEWLVLKDAVPHAPLLVDARAPERYRGDVEPLDPVAGHIPGAVNYPYKSNLGENGRFLAPETLRTQLLATLGSTDPDEAVFYCGSGVTACHDLLALVHAGLGNGRLYAGSWSDWIAG